MANPFSEVRPVTSKKPNTVLTIAAVAVAGALGLIALAAYPITRD